MNSIAATISICLLVGLLEGRTVPQTNQLNLNQSHNYYMPSVFESEHESELTNSNQPISSSIANYVFNFFERAFLAKTDRTSTTPSLPIDQNNSWSQIINEDMQQIHNSLSSMWEQTVANHLQQLKALMSDNKTLSKLTETYEQSIANMNQLQKDLISLWRQTKLTIISVDNKTQMPQNSELTTDYQLQTDHHNVWQTLKQHFNHVINRISSMWQQINHHHSDKQQSNQTDFPLEPLQSFNATRLQIMVIQMQQQFNHIWQNMANKIADSFNFDKNTDSDQSDHQKPLVTSVTQAETGQTFRGSLQRMDRIQRDVQQLWNSITANKQNDQSNQLNDKTIQSRIQSVWDNIKNYYNNRGNGSTIDGVLQSATDRVSRIGDYFKNIWQTATDAFSHSKQKVETHQQTISSIISSLSDNLQQLVSTVSQGVNSMK